MFPIIMLLFELDKLDIFQWWIQDFESGVVVHSCMQSVCEILEAMHILIVFETNYQSNRSVFKRIFF